MAGKVHLVSADHPVLRNSQLTQRVADLEILGARAAVRAAAAALAQARAAVTSTTDYQGRLGATAALLAAQRSYDEATAAVRQLLSGGKP